MPAKTSFHRPAVAGGRPATGDDGPWKRRRRPPGIPEESRRSDRPCNRSGGLNLSVLGAKCYVLDATCAKGGSCYVRRAACLVRLVHRRADKRCTWHAAHSTLHVARLAHEAL